MKRYVLYILLSFTTVVIVISDADGQTPEYFKWRVSDEKIQECADCSFGHATASYILACEFSNNMVWWKADLLALGIGITWEVKDGYVPWEKIGILGGEGFSKWDLLSDFTGIAIHRIKDSFWEHDKKHKYNIEKLKPSN